MKLHTLTATFGKLRQQTLELEDGLNIIEAPNEGGKTTWAGFLRAMLYGVNTREREKKGVVPEKTRCLPWEGGAAEGSMTLCWQGREIILRRTSRGNSPLSQFQAVYAGTEEPVPGLTADTVGEMLTGAGREVFERSAFVGQSGMAVSGSAELERRVSAMVSSGQEDVSYSETAQRLREWRNRRRSNQKNGLIPRMEAEQAEVSATLERLEGANRQAAFAQAQIRTLEEERAALEQEAKDHRALAGAQARARLAEAQEELTRAETALTEAQRERIRHGTPPSAGRLREMQGELSYLNTLDANIGQARRETAASKPPPKDIKHPVFVGMEPAAARARARADAAKAQACLEGGAPTQMLLLVLGILLLTGLGAALIYIFAHGNAVLFCVLAVMCLAALGAAAARNLEARRKRIEQADALLDSYGAHQPDEIITQAKIYSEQWEEAAQARTQAAVRTAALDQLTVERRELTARLLESVRTFAPEVTDLYGASAAVSRALNLGEKERNALLRLESARKVFTAVSAQGAPKETEASGQRPRHSEQEVAARLDAVRIELARLHETLAMAQGERNTLGDPAALQAQLCGLEEELTRRREEYAALTLAMEGLDEANALLQERMSPALNERAGEFLSRLTGGRYDQISLTREFEALAGQKGGSVPRKSLVLSRGTADQIYLAVRLAVCDLALPGDDPAPLVLDDALVYFDDERLGLALELLRELAGRRQILLFTCQSRERIRLEREPGVHIVCLSEKDALEQN